MENFIGLNIKYLRDEKKLGQDVFGNMFDVSKDLISAYENKRALPKIITIQKICKYFEISIDDFINTKLREKAYHEGKTPHPFDMEATRKAWEHSKNSVSEPKEVYQQSDKIIEQMELRINEKDDMIKFLRERLQELETKTKRQAG